MTIKKDLYERNKQAATGSNDVSFAYKSAEWTDKANGKAKITISAKDKATQADVKEVVYGLLTCSAHGFTRDLAVSNIKFLVENYGCVDVIIALDSNKKDCVIIEDIMTTDESEIKSILAENSFSGTSANKHYNTALYLGLCKYLNDTSHDPYAVYVSFDSNQSDTFTVTPSVNDDCWNKLKEYKNEGRYFSMGEEPVNTISQVTSYNAQEAIKAGLADPSVFVSMSSMTTSGDARCDNNYKQEFSTMSPVPIASAIKFTDTIDSRFEIDGDVTSNVPGAIIKVDGQKVDAGFSNLDQAKAAELYIPVKLKNGASAPNAWINTNSGNAKVTFGKPIETTAEEKTISSPKLYYDKTLDPTKKYSVKAEVVNGTIDPEGVTWAYVGTNLTVSYAPKEAAEGEEPYTLRSITVDGDPVDISRYPNSYTFKDITDEGKHTIKVVYSNKGTHNLTITKSISDTSYVQPDRDFWLLVTIKDDAGNAPSQRLYAFRTAYDASDLPEVADTSRNVGFSLKDDGSEYTGGADDSLKTTTRFIITTDKKGRACCRIYGIEDGMNVTISEINYVDRFTNSFDKPTIKVDGVEDTGVVETSHQGGGYQASTFKLDGDKTVEITNNAKKITPTGVGSAGNILLYIIIGMGMVGAALYLLRKKFN